MKDMPEITHDVSDETVALVTAELRGNISSFLVDRIRTLAKPWAKMTAVEQEIVIMDAERAARSLVTSAVSLIASDGRRVIRGTVNGVAVKDSIKAVISIARSAEDRHVIVDAVGSEVMIVVADPDSYLGGEQPEAEPDQGDILDTPVADSAPATAAEPISGGIDGDLDAAFEDAAPRGPKPRTKGQLRREAEALGGDQTKH